MPATLAAVHAAAPRRSSAPAYVQTTDGTRLFCRDWGQGRPVLFVGSWSLPSDSWCYSMLPLSEAGCRTLAFDRRGHGRSEDSGRGYDFDTLADDLSAVIEAADLRHVTLVGHSMACGEIVRYLTRHGSGRVARIALVSTTTPMLAKAPDNPSGLDADVFAAVRHQLMRDFPRWIEDNLAPFFTPETSPHMAEWVRGMVLNNSLQALVELNRSIAQADFRQELGRVDVPALVVHGTRDVSAPLELTGRPTAALIPHAELKVYEDAPHGLLFTHVDRLNADLRSFMERAPRATASLSA